MGLQPRMLGYDPGRRFAFKEFMIADFFDC